VNFQCVVGCVETARERNIILPPEKGRLHMPPRPQVYWNPFGRDSDTTLLTTQQYYGRKPNCRVVQMDSTGFLSSVTADTILLIDGHSDGLPNLSPSPRGKTYQYAMVAGWIAEHGKLPTSHKLIKLLACKGSFCAQCLSQRLAEYGYTDLIVGGYTNDVVHAVAKRTLILSGPDGIVNTTGSGFVKWYDGKGKEVPKPNL
jgi:hypothetical protein